MGGRVIMHTVVKGPSALATRRWQNMFLFAKITSEFVLAKCRVLHVLAPPGTPLHKRAGVRAWNFENDRYKIIKGT